jgi:hypothetical protein
MRTASTIVQWLVRVGGLVQIVLGGLFWIDNQLQLIPLHMLVGIVVVLGLLIQAVLGAFARVGLARVVLAVVWAPLVVWLGMNQATLLQGDFHWVIEVLHLAVGLAALAQAEWLARAIKGRRGVPAPAPAAADRVGLAGR